MVKNTGSFYIITKGAYIMDSFLHIIRRNLLDGRDIRTTVQVGVVAHEYALSIGATEWDYAVAVNDEIAHLKSKKIFKSGDVIKVDSWFKVNGLWIDGAITVIYGGKGSDDAHRLVECTRIALERTIKIAKDGELLSTIGAAVEDTAKEYNINIIRRLSGHGIGEQLHQGVRVRNFFNIDSNIRLKCGDRIAIEHLLTTGNGELGDDWCTTDGSLASHFESTVIVGTDQASQIYGAL